MLHHFFRGFMKTRSFVSFFALLGILTFSACREIIIDPWDPGKDDPKITPLEKYYGTEWRLESIVDYPNENVQPSEPVLTAIPENQKITLTITDGKAVGLAVCNDYSASVKVSESNIQFSNIASTKVACEDGSYDQVYLNSLSSAYLYSVSDEILEIYYSSEVPNAMLSLRFRRVKTTVDDWTTQFLPLMLKPTNDVPGSNRIVNIEGVKIDKDLVVAYSHSGGCQPVNFMFFADPTDIHTPEDGITITMVTNGEPDMCQAFVQGQKIVDMNLVRSAMGDDTKPDVVKIRLLYNGQEYTTEGYF